LFDHVVGTTGSSTLIGEIRAAIYNLVLDTFWDWWGG